MTKVCLICLVTEDSTKLFSTEAVNNEDAKRYENLTGIKLSQPSNICQRCSIDLAAAVNLKIKAFQSAKHIFPQRLPSKPKVNIISTEILKTPIDFTDLFKNNPNVTVLRNQTTVKQVNKTTTIEPVPQNKGTKIKQRRKTMYERPTETIQENVNKIIQKRYNTRQRTNIIEPIQFWIYTSENGYYLRTFDSQEKAQEYFNNLPVGSTYGELVNE